MVRVAWPLFAAGLVILGVHYLPWPARSQSQDTYRVNSSPAVSLTSATPGDGQSVAAEDPAPSAPKVQKKSQPPVVLGTAPGVEPDPLPPPPEAPPPEAPPSAGLPTWQDALDNAQKKLTESPKPAPPAAVQGPTSPPIQVPSAPPVISNAPPLPPGVSAAPPGPIGTTPPPPTVPRTDSKPFYPDPTEPPHAKPVADAVVPAAKQITSPWTFHLEIVDGKNVITARVGKTVQFKVHCDKVDIQSPFGTIQAQGSVKVTSLGLEVSGERMSIQLQEDSMVLEGKAQMKCQREGQEIDLRSERFSLRLSEIQAQTSSTSQSPPAFVPPLQRPTRPPIVDVSRDFP